MKKAVNHITKFLVEMAERHELRGNGLWATTLDHPELQKIETLDVDHEKKIKTAIKIYAAEAFATFVHEIFAQLAILLIEIKNQKDSHDLVGAKPDIDKLEKMGAESAEKFKMLVDVIKQAIYDVDWDHVAGQIVKAGKKANSMKEEGTGESGPFSVN